MPASIKIEEKPTKKKPRTLAELIQSLPTELYDEIFDYTLTCNEIEIEINKDYKPPVQLQINSHSREKFARVYYSEKIFEIEIRARRDNEALKIGGQWLLSLPLTHKAQVKDIRIFGDRENTGPDLNGFDTRQYILRVFWIYSNVEPFARGLEWSPDANVRANRWCQDERGEWRETWVTWAEMDELHKVGVY